MLLLDSQVTAFLFVFVLVAPKIILIDHLLKTFKFVKKEATGSEKKTS